MNVKDGSAKVSFAKPKKINLLSKLPKVIFDTAQDIIAIKIQGATNVAIATFNALQEWLKSSEINDFDTLLAKYEFYANLLANARPNEPLAKNGVRFVMYHIKVERVKERTVDALKQKLLELSNRYLDLIAKSKDQIVKKGVEIIKDTKLIFTHCHSSTVERLIIGADKVLKKTVVATETRPLFQGHITVRNLLKAGVDTIMIVDSAAPYFIKDDSFLPVDVVLIGADEITVFGDAINKVGSFAIGLSGYYSAKPVYVVSPSLKIDLSTIYRTVKLELRDPTEVWKDAPKGLRIINPAFDVVPREFIAGFITEFGLVKPEELEKVVRENYQWLS